MKHINLTEPNEHGLASIMVTQESNNFGDQILTLKQLATNGSSYEIIAITSRCEGDWMDTKEMKAWFKRVFNIHAPSAH